MSKIQEFIKKNWQLLAIGILIIYLGFDKIKSIVHRSSEVINAVSKSEVDSLKTIQALEGLKLYYELLDEKDKTAKEAQMEYELLKSGLTKETAVQETKTVKLKEKYATLKNKTVPTVNKNSQPDTSRINELLRIWSTKKY